MLICSHFSSSRRNDNGRVFGCGGGLTVDQVLAARGDFVFVNAEAAAGGFIDIKSPLPRIEAMSRVMRVKDLAPGK